MSVGKDNIFTRHTKKTIAIIILAFLFASLFLAELLLQRFMGLGNPVIYDSSPVYGFRPLPNREYRRFYGARIAFNNLGLRAERDWDGQSNNKILFCGDSVTYGGSYIDNKELFSYLAVAGLDHYESGNAGVNAWGVENIYGLIVESRFLPAEIYVTTLPEGDFYRGLTRCQGTPFFNVPPKFALVEFWRFFCYKQNNKRYAQWQRFASEEQVTYVVEKAARKLKAMDTFLKDQQLQHLLFITPRKEQVSGKVEKDPLVEKMLMKYDLRPMYIVDRLKEYNLSDKEKEELFHDAAHLQKKGHAMWARVIRGELEKLID